MILLLNYRLWDPLSHQAKANNLHTRETFGASAYARDKPSSAQQRPKLPSHPLKPYLIRMPFHLVNKLILNHQKVQHNAVAKRRKEAWM